MRNFYLLENVIRDYPWGDTRFIPDFLGLNYPDNHPAAELWMGDHPGAPSMVVDQKSGSIGLNELIASNPEGALGSQVARNFGRLPFLFKLLAAGKSLSIQVHPDKKTAEMGFYKENQAGIGLDSPIRNYKDNNHKPEIIMALGRFSAMIGFRSPGHIAGRFGALQQESGQKVISSEILSRLAKGDESALKFFLDSLLNAGKTEVLALLNSAEGPHSDWSPLEKTWVSSLAQQFPGDVGALAPLFLNVVELESGQALYQPARTLHAYLSGFGLELMANSDNVLRGGLTSKNMDIPELIKNLDFVHCSPEVLEPVSSGNGTKRYITPALEFDLSLSTSADSEPVMVPADPGPRIAIVLEGSFILSDFSDEQQLHRGMSVFIPAGADGLRLEGEGHIAWAGVPAKAAY